MTITTGNEYRVEIKELLAGQRLPIDDLPEQLDNFATAFDLDKLIGVAGLEIYGDYGLLRSVAVMDDYRNQGIAAKLLSEIETKASAQGLKELILLTETAEDYFARKGFDRVSRDEITPEVQQSSEFSHVCPQSAVAMKKTLNR